MTTSDIITLVSLVIAIVAIINEKNRKHLLLKISVIDKIIFVVAFFLLIYFAFYDSFYSRGLYIPQLYFPNKMLPKNPNNWAFPIALISLFYFFYKIWGSFFPDKAKEKVIDYYEKQIENGELTFLIDLIETYHKKDIIKYINKGRDYSTEDTWWKERYRKIPISEKLKRNYNTTIRKLFIFSWQNRSAYASWVLHNILTNPGFISFTAKHRPYFFADIVVHFKPNKMDHFPQDLVNSFLSELIAEKSFWLKKELKQSENFDSGQPEYFFTENKILGGLLKDLSVAHVNHIWQPFGEIAFDDIVEEREEGRNSKLYREFREEDFFWNYKVYFGIQFFKIIIIEAIVRKYNKSHFFFSYYKNITDAILETFEKYPPSSSPNIQTNYHKLIKEMVDNTFLWLRLSNKTKDDFLFYNIIPCLGGLIHSICDNVDYGDERKIDLVESTLHLYCNLENNSGTELFREELEKILLRPSTLTEEDHPYYSVISTAWDNFDKVPYYSNHGVDDDYFSRLKQNVILPLGLSTEN
jgi:hypothetical protein